MSTQTTNYGLVKPNITDFYDVDVMNNNLDIIDTTLKNKADQTEVDSLKKSVSDGKILVANAITGQGVTTANDATFATMATNIETVGSNKYNAGVTDTKKGTATAAQVLSGYTFTNSSSVGISGTIPSKSATTYTPGDSAQTISSGQYLSGVQTISAVPTETKTTTAGTSAITVSRTSGKYMTSVTVNPTPSQEKSITMTSSPMVITPDEGKLLSSVTISANLGKRYATGTTYESVVIKNIQLYNFYTQRATTALDVRGFKITHGLSWTPSVIKVTVNYTLNSNSHTCIGVLILNTKTTDVYDSESKSTTNGLDGFGLNSNTSANDKVISNLYDGSTIYFPIGLNTNSVFESISVTWEAWE